MAAQAGLEGGQQAGEDGGGGFNMGLVVRILIMTTVFQLMIGRMKPKTPQQPKSADGLELAEPTGSGLRNVFAASEECDLFVHLVFANSLEKPELPAAALGDESLATSEGFQLLWHTRVWYEEKASPDAVNVTLAPLALDVLEGRQERLPFLHATLVPSALLAEGGEAELKGSRKMVTASLPLVAQLRELNVEAGAENLLGGGTAEASEEKRKPANSSARLPYLKTKIDVRPLFDQAVYSRQQLHQPPFRSKLKAFQAEGVYQPYLYLSDFWLLEKDYVPLNETLAEVSMNITISYNIVSLMAWSIQTQMEEQWLTKSEWGLADSQKEAFMLKRLMIDTSPYFLGFSAAFMLLHTIFSWLAFKNDIQFWRKNESMKGLSARSMGVSFICQLITGLYLLESQETSRVILFEIFLGLALSFWKLKKAVKIEVTSTFPFLSIAGQEGYEEDSATVQYDREAIRYMSYLLGPCFVIYVIRSLVYDKHRSWYSFIISNAAGGVYTFGFIMMTPQLYINYKLKSVEHLPWRALTYKAMNTFVDDIFAFLIDMPMMHRLSCFRDDIIFLVYVYQRWAYRVDKTRASIYGEADASAGDVAAPVAVADGQAAADAARADGELLPGEAGEGNSSSAAGEEETSGGGGTDGELRRRR